MKFQIIEQKPLAHPIQGKILVCYEQAKAGKNDLIVPKGSIDVFPCELTIPPGTAAEEVWMTLSELGLINQRTIERLTYLKIPEGRFQREQTLSLTDFTLT